MSKRKVHRRSRANIIYTILRASLLGTTKTRLMIRTGLNYVNFLEYFNEMMGKELIRGIELSNGKMIFKITVKGKEALRALKEAEKHVEEL